MSFNQTESVADDTVKTEFKEISEDERDIDLNLTQSMDWKLNPNVECRVTLERLNILLSGNEMRNFRDSEMNVQRVQSSDADTDTYSKFILLVDELSNLVDKCDEKCGHCEVYIHQLQNHVIQTHVRSRTANRSHERDNSAYSSNNSNHECGISKNKPELTPSMNKFPNNEDEERRMSERHSGNQVVGLVGSLINPSLATLEHVNHYSTIAENLKQEPEPDDNLYQEDPLLLDLGVPSNLHLRECLNFSANVPVFERKRTRETELTGSHSKKLVGRTANTFFIPSGTKPKPFRCPICGNCFGTNGSLTRHKAMHTGEFKCDVCGKFSSSYTNFIIHKRKHTGVKPFKCSACGKCFTASTYLIKHNKLHSGESRFKCEVCGKGFFYSSALIYHKRTHTAETQRDHLSVTSMDIVLEGILL